jgi:hypothetical protein
MINLYANFIFVFNLNALNYTNFKIVKSIAVL